MDLRATFGPVHEHVVRTVAEGGPRARGLPVGIVLLRTAGNRRVSGTVRAAGDRVVHIVTLTRLDQGDEAANEE